MISLNHDFFKGIDLPESDLAQYYIDLAIFSANHNPDFQKSIDYIQKASKLLEKIKAPNEEMIRVIANEIQYHTHTSNHEACIELLERGDQLLSQSKSAAYNALYIFSKTLCLVDQGKYTETIETVTANLETLDEAHLYPTFRFWTLTQLALAYAKSNDIKNALVTLERAEELAFEFNQRKDDIIFANINVVKGLCAMLAPDTFPNAIDDVQKAIEIYTKVYKTNDKHKRQALANLVLAELFIRDKNWESAEEYLSKSESVYDQILNSKSTDDIGDLYKNFVIVGVNLANDGIVHRYLKKLLSTFSAENIYVKEALKYLDSRGIPAPI